MTKIAVVNLTWDDSQIKAESSNFSYVREGGEPHEKYNFKKTTSGYYGYFAHRKRKEGEQKYKQDKQEYKRINIVERFAYITMQIKLQLVLFLIMTNNEEKGLPKKETAHPKKKQDK